MDALNWRRLIAMCGAASLGFVAACSDDGETDTGVTPDAGFADTGIRPDTGVVTDGGNNDAEPTDTGEPPADAGFIKVNFTIDDSANGVYDTAANLAWKGSFIFDEATRIMERNPGWSGPYAKVWDDGPVAAGGHEPEGAVAGDHKWGIEALVAKPEADAMFNYGAVINFTGGMTGDWIWNLGGNTTDGAFTVPANDNAPVTAAPLVLPAFGTTDLLLEIDTSSLAPEFATFDPTNGINVKGSAWTWVEKPTLDDGVAPDRVASDGIFTFQLSAVVGPGTTLPYSGLLKTGDKPQFVFVLGGTEYKVAGVPSPAGVIASVKAQGALDWTPVAVMNDPDGNDHNTQIIVP
jgi:hypothetical protein